MANNANKLLVGCAAGFSGDRTDAALPVVQALIASGQPAVLIFETLAERTLALAQLARRSDPDAGFEPLLVDLLRPVLAQCLAHGVRIVSNFGAANPHGAARRIHALAAEMTLHDAGMTRLRQWWLRVKRSGYAFAEGAYLHGAPPERHRIRESRRAWAWGLGLPVATALAAWLLTPWAALLLLAYPLQVVRQFFRLRGSARDRGLRAAFLVLGRFPAVMGQLQFVRDRVTGRGGQLIEYK